MKKANPAPKPKKAGTRNRSAVTGRFVTPLAAALNPETTVSESRRKAK